MGAVTEVEYVGPYESVSVGHPEVFTCERGKPVELPDELADTLIDSQPESFERVGGKRKSSSKKKEE